MRAVTLQGTLLAAARSAAQTPDAPGAAGNAALLLARAVYLCLSKLWWWKIIIKEPTHTHSVFNRHLLMNIPSPDPAALWGLQLKRFYPPISTEGRPLPSRSSEGWVRSSHRSRTPTAPPRPVHRHYGGGARFYFLPTLWPRILGERGG